MTAFDAVFTRTRQDTVARRGAEESTASIEIALPILLHHSIHDMRLHHLKRIQVLQVIQRIFIHKVSLADQESDLLREKEVFQN